MTYRGSKGSPEDEWMSAETYAESILAWRRKLEESLRGDESWLETAGGEANDEG